MEHTPFRAFLLAVDAAPTPEAVWLAAHGFARALGYRRLLVTEHEEEAVFAPRLLLSQDAPRDFERFFGSDRDPSVDPVAAQALKGPEPFRLFDPAWRGAFSPQEARFMAVVRSTVPNDAVMFGVFGPEGRHAVCALGFDPERERPSHETVLAIRTACQIAHTAAARLRAAQPAPRPAPAEPAAAPRPLLSARENEVIHWVARGKSNSVIGDILGCSAHTVDTHLRRIFAKLDVSDRISAAVRAVALGLTSP